MSALGLLNREHTFRQLTSGKKFDGARELRGTHALCARSRSPRTRSRRGLSYELQRNARIKYNITSAAAAISDSGAKNGDPAPDAAGVIQYQRELLGRMMSFLGPATVIPLGEPLMSLVDTVCIGQVRPRRGG